MRAWAADFERRLARCSHGTRAAVLWEEMEAWERGWRRGRRRGLPRGALCKRRYDALASRALATYLRWAACPQLCSPGPKPRAVFA